MVRLEEDMPEFCMMLKDGERLHRRPTNGFDGRRGGRGVHAEMA